MLGKHVIFRFYYMFGDSSVPARANSFKLVHCTCKRSKYKSDCSYDMGQLD